MLQYTEDLIDPVGLHLGFFIKDGRTIKTSKCEVNAGLRRLDFICEIFLCLGEDAAIYK